MKLDKDGLDGVLSPSDPYDLPTNQLPAISAKTTAKAPEISKRAKEKEIDLATILPKKPKAVPNVNSPRKVAPNASIVPKRPTPANPRQAARGRTLANMPAPRPGPIPQPVARKGEGEKPALDANAAKGRTLANMPIPRPEPTARPVPPPDLREDSVPDVHLIISEPPPPLEKDDPATIVSVNTGTTQLGQPPIDISPSSARRKSATDNDSHAARSRQLSVPKEIITTGTGENERPSGGFFQHRSRVSAITLFLATAATLAAVVFGGGFWNKPATQMTHADQPTPPVDTTPVAETAPAVEAAPTEAAPITDAPVDDALEQPAEPRVVDDTATPAMDVEREEEQATAQESEAVENFPDTAPSDVLTFPGVYVKDDVNAQVDNWRKVDKMFQKIRECKGDIVITGHTCSLGDPETNLTVSKRRAEVISEFFRLRNFKPNRLIVEGKGSSVPIADNDTEAGRKQNRRVEISCR